MNRSLSNILPAIAFGAVAIAAIIFGEADDAPGLVMFGLLLMTGAVTLWVKPALLNGKRLALFIAGAIVVTAVGSLFAGWLEDNF